jgi:hypothetical protein
MSTTAGPAVDYDGHRHPGESAQGVADASGHVRARRCDLGIGGRKIDEQVGGMGVVGDRNAKRGADRAVAEQAGDEQSVHGVGSKLDRHGEFASVG